MRNKERYGEYRRQSSTDMEEHEHIDTVRYEYTEGGTRHIMCIDDMGAETMAVMDDGVDGTHTEWWAEYDGDFLIAADTYAMSKHAEARKMPPYEWEV